MLYEEHTMFTYMSTDENLHSLRLFILRKKIEFINILKVKQLLILRLIYFIKNVVLQLCQHSKKGQWILVCILY